VRGNPKEYSVQKDEPFLHPATIIDDERERDRGDMKTFYAFAFFLLAFAACAAFPLEEEDLKTLLTENNDGQGDRGGGGESRTLTKRLITTNYRKVCS